MRLSWVVVLVVMSGCAGDDFTSSSGTGSGGESAGPTVGGAGPAGPSGSGTTGSGTAGAGGVAGGGQGATAGPGGSNGGGPVGGSGGGSALPDCTDDGQCKLIDDCCNCVAIPVGDLDPQCNIPDCLQPMCSALGNSNALASCAVGHCNSGFACDPIVVTCDAPTPTCLAGETPSVIGACWGPCVPATQCSSVGDCTQCGPKQACVKLEAQVAVTVHCVDMPPTCGSTPSCACMGSSVCVGLFNDCQDGGGALKCSCPNC